MVIDHHRGSSPFLFFLFFFFAWLRKIVRQFSLSCMQMAKWHGLLDVRPCMPLSRPLLLLLCFFLCFFSSSLSGLLSLTLPHPLPHAYTQRIHAKRTHIRESPFCPISAKKKVLFVPLKKQSEEKNGRKHNKNKDHDDPLGRKDMLGIRRKEAVHSHHVEVMVSGSFSFVFFFLCNAAGSQCFLPRLVWFGLGNWSLSMRCCA
ncbi:hypothetical protein F5H01DRAFT_38654 [Linnemannia elongata]|nr:hypothetical protein F5H01DRAFT_38654 [Linnemannia elongata]